MRFMLMLLFTMICQSQVLFAATPTVIEWSPVENAENVAAFTAVGAPGFLKINGTGGKVSGTISELGGKVYGILKIAVKDLVTGIDLRDKHMHEKFLESAKFPDALLTLDPVQPNGTGFPFTGKLLVKGDTIAVHGTAIANTRKPNEQLITADFDVSMKDLPSVGVPSYLGVTVADKVSVHVAFLAISK